MKKPEKWGFNIWPTVKSHLIDEQFGKHWSKQICHAAIREIISFSCGIALISIAFDPVMSSFLCIWSLFGFGAQQPLLFPERFKNGLIGPINQVRALLSVRAILNRLKRGKILQFIVSLISLLIISLSFGCQKHLSWTELLMWWQANTLG